MGNNDIDLVVPSADNAQDILDILNDDSGEVGKEDVKPTEEPVEEANTDEEAPEETDDENKEEELELEDGTPELKEDDNFYPVPSRKEVLSKFPELYKTFPGLEKAVYREIGYSEVYPTIEEARDSKEALNNYQNLESQLVNGDSKYLFSTLKDGSPESFDKITATLLPTLAKIDRTVYERNILQPILKTFLNQAFEHGKENDDEQIQIAAQLLHRLTYGNTKITPPEIRKFEEQENPELKKFKTEKEQFEAQRLKDSEDEVSTKAVNVIKATLNKYIDPNGRMTPFIKTKAIEDAEKQVHNILLTDKRFRMHIDNLWRSAMAVGYSSASKEKIRNALLGKAKTVMGGIIRNVRAEALKGYQTRTREASETKDNSPVNRGRPAGNNSGGGGTKKPTPSKPDEFRKATRGMSTLDVLNMDDD